MNSNSGAPLFAGVGKLSVAAVIGGVALIGCGSTAGTGHPARSVAVRSSVHPAAATPSSTVPTPSATPSATPTTPMVKPKPRPKPKPLPTKAPVTHRVVPTTTAPPLTTVAPPARTTVAPPRRTTPPPPPRTTKPPAPTVAPANCDPAYPGICLHDGIGDYDCRGGSGNGPNYVAGPITVRAPDPFDLDANHDGTGCES